MKLLPKLFAWNRAPADKQARSNDQTSTPVIQPAPRWLTFAVCIILALMIWTVFGQTIHFGFINYDDPAYVYENPVINQGLSVAGIGWVFTHVNNGTWFPLTDISHQLDWQLYGSNAGGHHLTNVLLHFATVICLLMALKRLTGKLWPSAFVTAVFAIHPLRVESVAWVVERKDVLSGLFFALMLWAWAGHVHQLKLRPGYGNAAFPLRFGTAGYGLALVFFALGLLSKSMLVTAPFILLLLDFWPLNRLVANPTDSNRSRLRSCLGLILEKIPFLLLSTMVCIVTISTQKNAITVAHNSTPFSRAGNALIAYTDYLGHMFYPAGLTLAYARPQAGPTVWPVALAALLLAGISVIVLIGYKKRPWLLVGWLWYLGMLLPVIDIMQAGQNVRADRYTYLPQIGICILITWGAAELCASWRWRRLALSISATIILAALLAGACLQTSYWKDSVSIWTHALTCKADLSFVHNTLGSALFNGGNNQAAIRHFEQAIRLDPESPEAEVNLGIALATQGDRTNAIQHFERALQINPHSSFAEDQLGNALAAEGKPDEAIPHYRRALEFNPGYAGAHYDLGLALAAGEKWDEAVPHYEQALHSKLDTAMAQYVSGIAFAKQQKWMQAAGLYQRVLLAKPDFAEAHNHLAIALTNLGKGDEARTEFQIALTLANHQGNTTLAQSIRVSLEANHPETTHK